MDTREIAFAYAKGSDMLSRYLEMNGYKAISLGKHADVWIEDGNGVGRRTNFSTKREAKAFARKLSDHTGLPII